MDVNSSGSSNDPPQEPHVILVEEPTFVHFFPEVRHTFAHTAFVSCVEATRKEPSITVEGSFGGLMPLASRSEQKWSNDAWVDLPLEVFRSDALKRALPTACFAAWASTAQDGVAA